MSTARFGAVTALPLPRTVPGEGRVVVPWDPHDPRVFQAAGMPETDFGLAERFPDVATSTIRTDVEELLASLVREGLAQAPPPGGGDAASAS